MRKLVLSMVVSIDGYVEGVGGEFIPPNWSSDLDRWTFDMIDRFDTLLYGRIAWEMMARFWPDAELAEQRPEPQRALARFMNGSRKIVFSRQMSDASAWANSEIGRQPLADVVRDERNKPGKDLVIFAGARFAQSAIRLGLVDEYWLLTVPQLFGGGARLFESHAHSASLRLSEVRRMDTGAVLTRYIAES
jgi:dihydrofolate reductase